MPNFRSLGFDPDEPEPERMKKFINPETRSEFTKDDVDNMIIEVLNLPDKKLNDWQQKFIQSVAEQWEEKAWISEKQLIILEDIYARKTS